MTQSTIVTPPVEGYFKNTYDSNTANYPMPVQDVLTQEQADALADKIKELEADPATKRKQFKGISSSRIDDSFVGSSEFNHPTVRSWTDALGEHYVRKYRCKPSDKFLDSIGFTL